MFDYVNLSDMHADAGLARAQRLGIDLIFLSGKEKRNGHNSSSGIYLKKSDTKAIHAARNISKHIVVQAGDDLREVLEKCKNITIVGVEWNSRSDSFHYRSSGMNHILCALAKKRSISFLFDMKRYLTTPPLEQAKILGRFKQNILLYEKFRLEYGCASFAEHPYEIQDTRAFMRVVKKH